MGSHVPTSSRPTRRRTAQGFTLVEVLTAAAILSIFVVASLSAMTQINRWATSGRLRILSLALVQQKVDQIMTTPWSVNDTTPTVLAVGTTTENNLPVDNDTFNNTTGLSSVFSNLDTPITGTRTTVIASAGTRMVRATVTVTYVYRNRTATVSMNTLRATDDF